MDSGDFGTRVRARRQRLGLTQDELAARAGVSRQLVGAVENGRHLPRVDAAVAITEVLGVAVEALLGDDREHVASVVGPLPEAGTPVQVGRVGDHLVCAPQPLSWEGWGADAIVADGGSVEMLGEAPAGLVVAGCDPALGLAARMAGGPAGVLAVSTSTSQAIDALSVGHTHACVVHGPEGSLPTPPTDVRRWHLSRWRVGLAAPGHADTAWWRDALAGRTRVVQREAGAGSQAAFERAISDAGGRRTSGPVVQGHLEAAWLSARTGLPAVTIEPAARSAGLRFHPLEAHRSELWLGADWVGDVAVRRFCEVVASRTFARRLAAVGGYDLTDVGVAVDG